MSLSGLAVEEAGDLRQIRSERRLYVINIIETGTDLPSRNRQQRHRKIWRSGPEILLDVLSAVRPAGRTGYSAFFAPQLSRVCPLSASRRANPAKLQRILWLACRAAGQTRKARSRESSCATGADARTVVQYGWLLRCPRASGSGRRAANTGLVRCRSAGINDII